MAREIDASSKRTRVVLGYRDQVSRRQNRRKARTSVWYTDSEWSAIIAASAVERLRPGAWIAGVASEEARRRNGGAVPDRSAMAELLAELREHRRVLANIGGNLNDVAKAANATNDIVNETAATTVLGMVRRVVLASDQLVASVRQRLLS